MNKNILFISMDVHKESIEIAIAEGKTGKFGGMAKQEGTRRDAQNAAQTGIDR